MKVHYVRVSTSDQTTDRQKVNVDYDLLLEDVCSGNLGLFERYAGGRLKTLIEKGEVSMVTVHHIDRMARNTLDFLQMMEYFKSKKVNIFFYSQGLMLLDENGEINPTTNLVLSILSVVAQIERSLTVERIRSAIELRKAKKLYLGRKPGTKEDTLKFLSKPKSQRVIEYIRKGYKQTEISKITGVSPNTIIKIKRTLKTTTDG